MLDLCGVGAEPLYSGTAEKGFYLRGPVLAHTRLRTANPGTVGGKLLPSAGQLSIQHLSHQLFFLRAIALSCPKPLSPELPDFPCSTPGRAGASDSCLSVWHQGRSHHPCKQGVPSALHDNASIQTGFPTKANTPCDTVTGCPLSSGCAVWICRAWILPRQTPFLKKVSEVVAAQC